LNYRNVKNLSLNMRAMGKIRLIKNGGGGGGYNDTESS